MYTVKGVLDNWKKLSDSINKPNIDRYTLLITFGNECHVDFVNQKTEEYVANNINDTDIYGVIYAEDATLEPNEVFIRKVILSKH